MACSLPHPSETNFGRPVCATRMTRCECADISFQEVARQMAARRLSCEEVARGTGCGQTCTACIPDLLQYLSAQSAQSAG